MSSRSVPRILVVDDTDDVRRVHACFLDGAGMEVLTAENGTLALDMARRTLPDVIVTDVEMPVMNGLDLCRNVRADATTRSVAVVVVTGDTFSHTRAALDAGCNVVLGKPCSRTILLATIRLLLEQQVTVGTMALAGRLD